MQSKEAKLGIEDQLSDESNDSATFRRREVKASRKSNSSVKTAKHASKSDRELSTRANVSKQTPAEDEVSVSLGTHGTRLQKMHKKAFLD
jgi:hypothetical protein